MAEPIETPGTTPVVDRRPVPRGVLPRGVQTWLMVAVALGMMFIIFLTGRPEGPAATRPATAAVVAPTADRVRDYQERLRLLDEQAAREAREAAAAASTAPDASGSRDERNPVRLRALHRRANRVRAQSGDRQRVGKGQGLPAVARHSPGLLRPAQWRPPTSRRRRCSQQERVSSAGMMRARGFGSRTTMFRMLIDARGLLATAPVPAPGAGDCRSPTSPRAAVSRNEGRGVSDRSR